MAKLDLDNVVEKAKDIFSEAGRKTGDFVSIQKLRVSIADLNSKIRKLYTELGRLTYESSKNDTDNSNAIDTAIVKIEEMQDELESLKIKINDMKNKRTCPACGKANGDDAVFCSYCGEKLVYTYDSEEDEDEVFDPTAVYDDSDDDEQDTVTDESEAVADEASNEAAE